MTTVKFAAILAVLIIFSGCEKTGIEWLECSGSTAIRSANYDHDTLDLNVWFTSSYKTYAYKKVPVSVWNDWKLAESKGGFYNLKIKGKY